jgi:vanillate O-demethylase ferredoxin subunit
MNDETLTAATRAGAKAAAPTIGVRVRHLDPAALDVRVLTLAFADSSPLPRFTPGAHIDVHLPFGIVRQYSLCGEVSDSSQYTIAVKLEESSRGGSRYVHDALCEGDLLRISAPRNNFPLRAGAGRHFLLAGGIGITPLLAMARQLVATREDFHLHYFARSYAHATFAELLGAPVFRDSTTLHLSLDAEATGLQLGRILADGLDRCALYICGPRPFIEAANEVAHAQGWPEDNIHVEHFGALPVSTVMSGAFTVRLARTGRSVDVGPSETIVDALAKEGVEISTSCESGFCGTCITGVLDGVPDYRDDVLSASDRASCRHIVPCVSRSKTPVLVLDL